MTTARSSLINLNITPYYHCSSYCVRRAFIYGTAKLSRNYYARKAWLLTRMDELTKIFAIQICAFAIFRDQYHLILYVNKTQVNNLGKREIIKRWGKLFARDVQVLKFLSFTQQQHKIAIWRDRLMSISWFMRCLNESVALYINQKEGRSGRFWDGRFKSQAIINGAPLLKKYNFIDLSPKLHASLLRGNSLDTSELLKTLNWIPITKEMNSF